MSGNTCECGKPTRDAAYVCEDCLDRFTRVLNEMPWLDDELATTIGKLQAAATEGGSQSAEQAVMFNEAAAKRRTRLRHELVMAVRFCTEEGVRHQSPSTDLPADTIPAMARWLLWRTDGLAFNDMGGEFVKAITDAARSCRKIIDSPPERRYAGPCPECGRDLYHRPAAAEVACAGCGSRWDVGEVSDWMRHRINEHLADRMVTEAEGSTLLGRFGLETPRRRIAKWHEHGKLAEAGRTQPDARTGKTRRLYRWADLLVLATHHAAKDAQRHGAAS